MVDTSELESLREQLAVARREHQETGVNLTSVQMLYEQEKALVRLQNVDFKNKKLNKFQTMRTAAP